MQALLKIKLLQHLFGKDSSLGFRGWKLLGAIIILAILGVSALLLTLGQTSKCGGSFAILAGAKTNIGAMNRFQQAYFLENYRFDNSIEELELGIKTQTENYTYSTKATAKAAFNYAVPRREYISQGWFGLEKRMFYGFVGGVFVESKKVGEKEEKITVAILCQAKTPSTVPPAEPTYKNGILACGAGTSFIR